jgi:Calcineurin-like phosphoesterase
LERADSAASQDSRDDSEASEASEASGNGADGVLLLGLGDAHGALEPLFTVARREPQARALLQVGDLTAGKAGRETGEDDDPSCLRDLPLPLVWIHGNHEHWELLGFHPESGARDPAPGQPSLLDSIPGTHLWPGDVYTVPGTGVRVAGLPGNFAPTWYGQPKPFPGDRVRHFNEAEVRALEALPPPAVLLLHEAFRGQAPGRLGMMGVPALAALVRRLRPAVCLTGHHHLFNATQHGPTLALALPLASAGYVRLRFSSAGELLGWELVEL